MPAYDDDMARGRRRAGRSRGSEFYEQSRRDVLFLACVFIGLGLGEAISQPGAGLIGGIGLGVLLTDYLKQLSTTSLWPMCTPSLYMALLIVFYFAALIVSYYVNKNYPSQYYVSALTVVTGLVLVFTYIESSKRPAQR